ncbi:MAG: NAD(P)H-dependent oxidoreductase [Chryseolinea sp.]
MEELTKYPEQYTVHDVYHEYADEKIDVHKEQRIVESYNKIVFQFPFYWFSCPPLFKKWLDEVLTHGWAYGSASGYKLKDKKIALAITAGIDEVHYSLSGRYKYTLQQLTAPFELTFDYYVKADYKPLFAFYGAEHNATEERIEKGTRDFISFIDCL